MGLVSELRRRNVFRMGVLYVVAAWLIMQVAEVIIALANLSDWIGPAILGLLAIGFPIALLFSWFYELTPEGLALEKDVDRAASITHITGRRIDFIVISMLTAAVILFAWHTWWPSVPTDKSIAVLPFANMSDDPGQEYFSDGISEELLNALSKIPDLRVTARSSSFQFKGENRDVIEIGQKLNAAFVLEGSVRKAGRQVRITAQLIDASNGFHLWSDTYDRELENIFEVQDEISAAITRELKEQLGLQVSVPPRVVATPSTEAYEAYLRGRYLVVQRTNTSIEGAVREFEKAITLDPDYALAHAELAFGILMLSYYSSDLSSLTETEAIARATPHASRAMALDPGLAEVHYVTGVLSRMQRNPEQALTHFRQAIQINPNFAQVYVSMGVLIGAGYFGRYDEGFAMTEKALRLDPLSIPARWNYVRGLISTNRLDEADREIEKLAAINPSNAAQLRGQRMSLGGNWANILLGDLDSLRIEPIQPIWALGWLGIHFAMIGLEKEALAISEPKWPGRLTILRRHGEAVTTAEAALAEDPTNIYDRRRLGLALASAGEHERARPILEDMWERSGGRVTTREGLFFADCAAALIAIRRDAGEETGVGELMAAMRDNVRRYREADITSGGGIFRNVDYEEGLAAYLAGEHERGLALIAKAVEGGFFIMPWEAYLQGLYDDPGFAPIRAKQEARQVREREKFLAIVCNDNPYASFWQPAEGTCEQFAAAQAN
jgi:TolB-like protein